MGNTRDSGFGTPDSTKGKSSEHVSAKLLEKVLRVHRPKSCHLSARKRPSLNIQSFNPGHPERTEESRKYPPLAMVIPPPSASPSPSALTTLLASNPPPSTASPHHHALALQILHNLQYQHDWTDIRLHYHSPLPSFQGPASPKLLPRPLISGLPPTRIYIHPDEQVELLKAGKKGKELGEVREREWVLPSHIREKWSLRRIADCFDGVGEVPEGGERVEEVGGNRTEKEDKREVVAGETEGGEDQRKKTRRGGKRMLLATVCDDSTVVYYIVHDGIVKPRQN